MKDRKCYGGGLKRLPNKGFSIHLRSFVKDTDLQIQIPTDGISPQEAKLPWKSREKQIAGVFDPLSI